MMESAAIGGSSVGQSAKWIELNSNLLYKNGRACKALLLCWA